MSLCVAYCLLFVVGCVLLVVCLRCSVFAVCFWLSADCYVSFVVWCLVIFVFCALFAVYIVDVCCSLLLVVVSWRLRICSLFVMCGVLLYVVVWRVLCVIFLRVVNRALFVGCRVLFVVC